MSKANTNTAVNMGSPVDPVKNTKQGHAFLFCLCDMRRAVIVLDTIGLGLGIAAILFTIVAQDKEDMNTDLILSNHSFGVLLAIQCAVTLCHLSSIIGAVTFTICPILITILMDIAYCVLCGLGKNWIGLGVYAFLLYPHFVLCAELAHGITTRENYICQERRACCCV